MAPTHLVLVHDGISTRDTKSGVPFAMQKQLLQTPAAVDPKSVPGEILGAQHSWAIKSFCVGGQVIGG